MAASRPEAPPPAPGDRAYRLAFALVDALACLEVGAVLVVHASVSESLGLREELSGLVLTTYLYPLFGVLLLTLLLDRRIRHAASPRSLLLLGLGLFAAGSGLCALAPSPALFFPARGVLGVGAALAFAGQLWSGSVRCAGAVAGLLVWGEAGAALGDLAGPLLGALFARFSPEGWRGFFLFEGTLALLTLGLAVRGLRGEPSPPPVAPQTGPLPRGDRALLGWQVAVSLLLVGTQYFFSDQLQQKMGEGPLLVGGMNLLASAGTVLGAWGVSRAKDPGILPLGGVLGGLLSLGGLAACLLAGHPLLAGLPLLASGAFAGLAGVSLFASLVREGSPEGFLRCTLLYLLAQQVGNALGVQAVSLAEGLHLGVVPTALTLAALPAVLILGLPRRTPRREEEPAP